jgi:glyoxylase-like metal-dependent hydrolase (beta-lactamase superfamily II)
MGDDFPTFHVGDVTIIKVEELVLDDVPLSYLYPSAKVDDFQPVTAQLDRRGLGKADASFRLSVHSWVVRTPDQLIIIDTGSGNDKERPTNPLFHRLSTPYLARLQAAGVDPAKVDYVFNTHLHVDHSGWNTVLKDGRWVPTFPNARYVLPRAERDYYASPVSHNEANVPSRGVYEDSVLPVIEAGLVDFVGPEGAHVLDLFEFIPTPGHSIGHMSIGLTSKDARAIFAGDILHHPFQVYRPDLNTVFCEFKDEAIASRAKMLNQFADTGALYLSTHFPGSSAGYVARRDHGFVWTNA